MKVLIVDDSKAMRMIVKRTLGQTDVGKCTVVEAENGADGLAKVASEKPDLVLCDWNMPEMSGIDFLRSLRAGGSRVTFGFITSESGQDTRNLALETGAQFIITKPFTAESLNAAVSPCMV
ncbi:MAG: response regulator [Planctomycetaceae bacterium]|nr:response regulator [Planctomycetaceae bacterium]